MNLADGFRQVFYNFQEFVFSSNFVWGAFSFCTGLATKELIEHCLSTIILPLFLWILQSSFVHRWYHSSLDSIPHKGITIVLKTLGDLLWVVFRYATLLILSFVILEYVVYRKIFGLRSTVTDTRRLEFARARQEAERDSIIPTYTGMRKVEAKKALQAQELREANVRDAKKVLDVTNDQQLAAVTMEGFGPAFF